MGQRIHERSKINVMSNEFVKYISSVNVNEVPDSIYQFHLSYVSGNSFNTIRSGIQAFYYSWLYSSKIHFLPEIIVKSIEKTERLEFLEFHLNKYSGDSTDFIDFIEQSLDTTYIGRIEKNWSYMEHGILLGIAEDYHYSAFKQGMNDNKEDIDKLIHEWIDKKRGQFSLRGFDSQLSIEVLNSIFQQMTNEGFIKGRIKDFEAIFNNQPLHNIEPLVWLKNHNNKGNKTALRDILTIMLGKLNFNSKENSKRISHSFIDTRNNRMELNSPKQGQYSKYYRQFDDIIKEAKV